MQSTLLPIYDGLDAARAAILAGRREGVVTLPEAVQARVREVAYFGDSSVYHLELASGKPVRVTAPNIGRGGAGFAPGERLRMRWPADSVVLLTE